MNNQQEIFESSGESDSCPVECLGQSFESDVARREHYTELLREKLKDPEFRKIEGFPIGEDDDILALSDPPYYTACPNPWIQDFVEHYGRPYDPKEKYHREPFAADVQEGKHDPIYNAHSYHTKVPHKAIMRYILHYTEPGDVVFDGFCGTGMTGVAAQLCGDQTEVLKLGYRVDPDGTIYNEEGESFSKLGSRRAMLNDLSPAATFIAYNYNTPVDQFLFQKEADHILNSLEAECGWMYETRHSDGKKYPINYTVWSDVFVCPECAHELVFWDVAVDVENGKVRDSFPCPNCSSELTKRAMERSRTTTYDKDVDETYRQSKCVPVRINYSVGGKRKSFDKKPDHEDLELIDRIDQMELNDWFPNDKIMDGDKTPEAVRQGFTRLHHLFTRRNLIAFSKAWNMTSRHHRWAITGSLQRGSKQHQIAITRIGGEKAGVGGATAGHRRGTLYIPSNQVEMSVLLLLRERFSQLARSGGRVFEKATISTDSATGLSTIPNNSLDYVFVDPPFGANIMYSELSQIWEGWLRVNTNISKEAIENKTQKKGCEDYRGLMRESFSKIYDLLKPGRWMTVEFSNTKASVWNSIQSALSETGFIIANVSALDKGRGGLNAIVGVTAVKQDLIISAYKPSAGLEQRFVKHGDSVEGVWDFLQTHLKNLPVVKPKGGSLEFIAERDPRILYDRMVAFYVGHNIPVPLSSGEFQAALHDKYPERDGMVFLHEQVAEYDKKRAKMENVGQMSIFVEDEKSAINWLRGFLKNRPSVYADIQPEFMQQLSASWKKFEYRPELSVLLDQNFIKYTGEEDVPTQINTYLSKQIKKVRRLERSDPALKKEAIDRWYVPDPGKAIDKEKMRDKRLLTEFWSYLPPGYVPPKAGDAQIAIPGLEDKPKTKGKSKKLKEVRTEAVRVGFKHCHQSKDYTTIMAVAEVLPKNVIEEDEQLQMIYDMAEMRSE